MNNDASFRRGYAEKLAGAGQKVPFAVFAGLDGFIDEIIHVVDKRDDLDSFHRVTTIQRFADRIAAAAGKSTNIELVTRRTKLGGNGPIFAYALAQLGCRVTYLGALGYPALHPVFHEFAQLADVHPIAEAAHTDALEFEDGKLMLGKMTPLNEVTWDNIQERYGGKAFANHIQRSDLVAFVNWTMVPHMSRIWQRCLEEICPSLPEGRRFLFFDLADPAKRTREDIVEALKLIRRFQQHFNVVLGLNEKESSEIAQVLGLMPPSWDKDGLSELARQIHQTLDIHTLVIHPVAYALAVSGGRVDLLDGPYVQHPVITTGAGDHFNAGFCLGKLLGLDNPGCLLTGTASSGFYVRTGQSPTLPNLAKFLDEWPER